jgi:hypothetical protein
MKTVNILPVGVLRANPIVFRFNELPKHNKTQQNTTKQNTTQQNTTNTAKYNKHNKTKQNKGHDITNSSNRCFNFVCKMFVRIGKRSLDRISLDRNCHFSVDQNFTNHLIEFFDTFHLIESFNNEFGQVPKSVRSF